MSHDPTALVRQALNDAKKDETVGAASSIETLNSIWRIVGDGSPIGSAKYKAFVEEQNTACDVLTNSSSLAAEQEAAFAEIARREKSKKDDDLWKHATQIGGACEYNRRAQSRNPDLTAPVKLEQQQAVRDMVNAALERKSSELVDCKWSRWLRKIEAVEIDADGLWCDEPCIVRLLHLDLPDDECKEISDAMTCFRLGAAVDFGMASRGVYHLARKLDALTPMYRKLMEVGFAGNELAAMIRRSSSVARTILQEKQKIAAYIDSRCARGPSAGPLSDESAGCGGVIIRPLPSSSSVARQDAKFAIASPSAENTTSEKADSKADKTISENADSKTDKTTSNEKADAKTDRTTSGAKQESKTTSSEKTDATAQIVSARDWDAPERPRKEAPQTTSRNLLTYLFKTETCTTLVDELDAMVHLHFQHDNRGFFIVHQARDIFLYLQSKRKYECAVPGRTLTVTDDSLNRLSSFETRLSGHELSSFQQIVDFKRKPDAFDAIKKLLSLGWVVHSRGAQEGSWRQEVLSFDR